MKRKWIIQAFIGSSVLNIALLFILFAVMWKEYPQQLRLSYLPAPLWVPPIERQQYEALASLPYESLCSLIEDKTSVKNHYKIRDVALGILVSKHQVDVKKLLGREIAAKPLYDKGCIFPGLTNKDFIHIQKMLHICQMPFTPEGLFNHLPQSTSSFCVSEPYLQLETLICRLIPKGISTNILIKLCQESGWPLIESLWKEQRQGSDYSSLRARQFLLDALDQGSRQAAYLLILSSPQHYLEELTDVDVGKVLEKCDVQTRELVLCCRHIAATNRSRVVRELAIKTLAVAIKGPDHNPQGAKGHTLPNV